MPYVLSGWNPFYEGWLAGALGLPHALPPRFRLGGTQTEIDGWKEGYATAVETRGVDPLMVLRAEIDLGHVRVTWTSYPPTEG